MEIQDVVSSNLVQVGYESETNKLHVAFKSGAVYIYDDVPRDIFVGLTEAPSAGSYFHQNVRNKFAYTKKD